MIVEPKSSKFPSKASYLPFNDMDSSLDENQDLLFNFSTELTIPNSSHMPLISNFHTVISDDFFDFPVHVDDLDFMDDFSLHPEEFEVIFGDDIKEKQKFSSPPQMLLVDDDIISQPSLILPSDEMEVDDSLALAHLVKAYGEAMEREHRELAEVIVKCIIEKVSPIGETMERLLYYLFQASDKSSIYLKQESTKNFIAAFKAFSMLLPYTKFAFFTANRAILESIPCDDVDIIQVVDFNIGEGTQWSSLMEDIGRKGRELKVRSIKWPENSERATWRFKETKRRLIEYARIFGLKFDMEEVELHDLEGEMKTGKRMCGKREKLVFNCMVGLAGRVRRLRNVLEFLKTAKEILKRTPKGDGVLTFGNGDSWEVLKNCSSFSTYLDGHVLHYQALLESMECTIPSHLGDARTAIECLFVSPFVSSRVWVQNWEDRNMLSEFWSTFGLENWRVSKDNFVEATEIIRDTQGVSSPYSVMVEGNNNSEMVLKWNGVQLLRVSFWKS